MTIEWKLEVRNVKDLKPHPKNPRVLTKHEAGHLDRSLEKFGLIDKPCVNLDGTIIGGHQRIALLKKKGIKELEVWVPVNPLSPEEVDELNIRLNRNNGEWDWDCLANDWGSEDLISWGFNSKDFEMKATQGKKDADRPPPGIDDKCPTCGKKMG